MRCKFALAAKKAEAKAMAEEMSALVDAEVAQVIGHTALFYRPSARGIYQLPDPAGD